LACNYGNDKQCLNDRATHKADWKAFARKRESFRLPSSDSIGVVVFFSFFFVSALLAVMSLYESFV